MTTGDLVSTGIVEIKHDGIIHRGEYRTDGAEVTVSYGGQVRRLIMRRRDDEPHAVAGMLLRTIVIEIHDKA